MKKNSSNRIRRLPALLLALALVLAALTSCVNDEDVPEGMIDATCAGAPYRLYVLESWTPKTGSGVSGAYLSLTKLITVSMYDAAVEEGTNAVSFSDLCLAEYAAGYADFAIVKESENAVGGQPAHVAEFTFTLDETPAHCLQAVAVVGSRAYVFLFVADEAYYADYLDQVYEMIAVSVLDTSPAAYEMPNAAVPDETPAGMYCISPESVGFYCFVPLSWQRTATEVPGAKAPGDNTNVSAMMYSDSRVTGTDAYFAVCDEEYAVLPGFTVLETGVTEMSGMPAAYRVFTVTINGTEYKLQQTVVGGLSSLFGPETYVLTYTSTAALYESHLADYYAMVDAFVIR